MNKVIKIHPSDNLVVAMDNLKKGEKVIVENDEITLLYSVKQKHKFAQSDLNRNDPLIMYGVKVGVANQKVLKGEPLTTNNMDNDFSDDISFENVGKIKRAKNHSTNHFFMGYPRKDGRVGTQNVWLFFPLVFCENRNIELLKTIFEREFYPDKLHEHQQFLRGLVQNEDIRTDRSDVKNPFPNVEIRFITHNGGCGGTRSDSKMLARLLSGYANNPNVAGVSVLSLGCQNLQVELFLDELKSINPSFDKPLLIFDQQKVGKGDELIKKIIKDSIEEIKKVNEIKIEKCPLSKLTIGLEC